MTIPFYGIMLHEIDKLIDNPENLVFILSCNGILRNCVVNKTSDRAFCKVCQFARNVGEKPYLERVKMIHIEDYVKAEKTVFPVLEYGNTKDIQNIMYKGCYIGYGALSSYVSYTRNQEPVMDQEFRNYFDDLLKSEILLINSIENLFSKLSFDEVYLYNGRWADVRPVFDICLRDKIKVNVLESVNNGTTSFDREIYVNVLPQDISYRNGIIEKIWKESELDDEIKEKLASDFYIRRKNADFVRGDIKVFTAEQQSDKLPDGWDTSKRNISIFNSSEDEFIALGKEWDMYQIFANQESGIKEILSAFEINTNYHFYLRIHPNLSNVPYGYHKRLYDLEQKYKNVTVIAGDSKVSTYKLIDHCEKVIVFGSSVGAEACYWRKPVILLGGTTYYLQGLAYIPVSLEETFGLIEANLEPKPIIGALKFGFYLMNHHLYTETINCEPYPIMMFGKTIGYGFKHMRVLNSPLLFKVIYKLLIYSHRVLRLIVKDKKRIPVKGY